MDGFHNDNDDSQSIGSISGSDSTESEERLKRLFESCDRDKDGFIDSEDLLEMCKKLNMEEAFAEMTHHLHLEKRGNASFQDFLQCRQRLMDEIEQEHVACSGLLNTDSDQSSGVPAWSHDYESGTRDVSPESASFYSLLERHDADYLQQVNNTQYGPGFLEVANMLHLAALTSLRTEVIELSNALQRVKAEKQQLERQLRQSRAGVVEEQATRYEDRITELHSVIAELRRKLDARQFNVIREEDEEVGADKQAEDTDSVSANDNHATQSLDTSAGALDWEAEMSQVISTFNRALQSQPHCLSPLSQHQLASLHPGPASPVRARSPIIPCSSSVGGASGGGGAPPQNLPIKPASSPVSHSNRRVTSPLSPSKQNPGGLQSPASSQNLCPVEEQIQYTANSLQEQIQKQQESLERTSQQLQAVRDERDRLKYKVRELQSRLQSVEDSSAATSCPGSPLKSPHTPLRRGSSDRMGSDQSPGPKVAELKKLKTSVCEDAPRQVLGVDISAAQLQTAKVAEHLVQNMLECSSIQEIVQSAASQGGVADSQVREFEVEVERLQSKIDHLRAQHDLLGLSLEESKATCNHLTELMGKYESNETAWQLTASCSEQLMEAQEALVLLLDSQQSVLLANYKAAGLSSTATTDSGMGDDGDELTEQLHKAHVNRKGAEHIAKQLVQKLDRQLGVEAHLATGPPHSSPPWEELSSTSRTNSTTSSVGSAVEAEFSKMDERRLREHIKHLKQERHALQGTVAELEGVQGRGEERPSAAQAAHMDLENAVLMQELMAIKEEKCELKAQNYLLTKEKASIDLQLCGKESREQAYIVQIEHLKSEVSECKQRLGVGDPQKKEPDALTPSITLAELRSQGLDSSQAARDLAHALKREELLRKRVAELMATLDRLSKNAESRHKQSAEFVNDLKKANSALVSAFEKAKKKYQTKMKKMEGSVEHTSALYQSQIAALQQRLEELEKQQHGLPTT